MRNNRKASSMVLLAIVFVSISIAICSAIIISRKMVTKSQCEIYSSLWAKSILSEYDLHLLEDYGIMAYFGNEAEVQGRIDRYMEYSMGGKLDSKIEKSSAELCGYELGNPENFKEALKKSGIANIKAKRKVRNDEKADEEYKSRTIVNNVVIDTLPSGCSGNQIRTKTIVEKIKNKSYKAELLNTISDNSIEYSLIKNRFGNHVTYCDEGKCFFRNEWEYIIAGNLDDDKNYKICKTYIFAIRNAMNLAYLYTDNEKQASITAAAELINPAAAPLIQAAISEVWAAAEADNDIDVLLDNGRVPLIKTDKSWKTDLGSILDDEKLLNRLDEESRNLLEENKNDIISLDKGNKTEGNNDGQNYDDYLILMMLSENSNLKLLRCMDVIQINMKYRYYRDFNMMEYYTGVRFTVKANGVDYETEDYYR